MAVNVPDEGTGHEALCVIGEAPATQEVAQRRPFVGPSGHKLMGWMAEVGLQRSDAYWTNVFPYQAPGNKISKVPPGDLAPWIEALHERLARLEGPVVLVPTGDTALRALIHRRGLTITKARGSILTYVDRLGRSRKVIPTIHPAAIFRTPAWERRCRLDWRRIAGDLLFPDELRLPQREHQVNPTLGDLWDFLDLAANADSLAIDIETPRQRMSELVPGRTLKSGRVGKPRWRKWLGEPRVTCIGYSVDPRHSLTIPTTPSYWGDDYEQAWKVIETLHALPQAKVLQNGLFDTYWLMAIAPVRQYRWDTRWLHHALDPLDSHSLAYMASVDTREPYWKDDGKDGDGEGEWTDLETFWRYCGKDAALTLELSQVYRERLGARGALPFYLKHYQALYAPLLRMMRQGLRLDEEARTDEDALLKTQRRMYEARLTEIAGTSLAGKTDLSNKKLATYLYDTLKLPRQLDRQTKAVTTKEVTVRKLMIQKPNVLGSIYDEPETCTHAGPLILAHRRASKLSSFLKEGMADADGRVRTQYGFTETLRLTSGKNPRRTGANLQNVDRALRHLYVPEPGMFFLEVDASQGEDRIVKCLTGSARLIERALAQPWENDEHTRAARVIWPDLPITPERRYIGKRARHAGNYGLMGLKFSEELLKDGVVVSPEEGQKYIDTVIDRDTPEVREWQRLTRAEVMRYRAISNTWGQVWDFQWERLDDDLYRFAYAARPQSELVNLVNQYGLVPLDRWLRRTKMRTILHHQNHDSLLVSTTLDEAYDVAEFLRQGIGKPRTYAGTRLAMPVEVKCGLSWALPLEFKRPVAREEFNARIAEMLKGVAPWPS